MTGKFRIPRIIWGKERFFQEDFRWYGSAGLLRRKACLVEGKPYWLSQTATLGPYCYLAAGRPIDPWVVARFDRWWSFLPGLSPACRILRALSRPRVRRSVPAAFQAGH